MLFGCGGSAATTVTRPVSVVSVSMSDASVTLGAGETYQLTATVTGTSNTAVTWSLSGCATGCGTISATGLYTAPSVLLAQASVTVTATSQADSTKFATCSVQLMPITVSIAPAGAWVAPGATLQVTGRVSYDGKNAGVTWALAAGCSVATCGALSNVTLSSVTYTAPATVPNSPAVTLTATSITDPSKTAATTITISVTHALAAGDYTFIFNGWEIQYEQEGQYYTPHRIATAGHFHADSSGNITNGVEDVNSSSGVSQSVRFTGAYGTGSDGRGDFTITTSQGTATYHMTVATSGNKGEFIKYDGLPANAPISGSGHFERQDNTAFSLSALAGPHAVGLSGTFNIWNRVAAVGRFNTDATGMLSAGTMDVTGQMHGAGFPQVNSANLALTGTFSAPSPSTGRGTAALALSPAPTGVTSNLNFAYYVISNDRILLVQTDRTPVLSGEIRSQNGTYSAASFNGPGIFSMTGVDIEYGWEGEPAVVGQVVSNGSGSITGIVDGTTDDPSVPSAVNQAFTGSYSLGSNGRASLTLQLGSGNADTAIAYFFGQNEAFLMRTSGSVVLFGNVKPQAGGPFTAASVSGVFRTYTDAPPGEDVENDSGLTTWDGTGGVTATVDLTDGTQVYHYDLAGTYGVTPNGRGTLTFSPAMKLPEVFWLISPKELVGIGTLDPASTSSVLLEYER
jgi:hypothetical protein